MRPFWHDDDFLSDMTMTSHFVTHRTNKILEYVSLFVILASVVTLCVESLPQYRLNQTDGTKLSTKGTPLFFAETVWTAFFTLEYG